MRFTEVSDTLNITERKTNSIPIIKSKIESHLNAWKARTILTDNVIAFKTINIYLGRGYIDTNPILLRIYKEGKIIIDKEGSSLKIRWTVKLDTLYFLALCPSIILGIITLLTEDIQLIYAIFIGLAFFLMFIFMGILFIKYRLNDMIYSCVYPNYY